MRIPAFNGHRVLLLAGCLSWAPLSLAVEPSYEELLRRVEALEQQHQALDNALDSDRLSDDEPQLVTRLKDVELRTYSMQKQARTIAALEGITASLGVVMVAQNANKTATMSGNGESHLNYRADVVVTLPAGEVGRGQGSLFSQFRLGQGGGMLDLKESFTSSNATTFQISGPPSDSTAMLAQVWYQLDTPLGDVAASERVRQHLVLNVGKMDPFLFFDQNAAADDETTRFINSAFVHNPLLDAGGDVGVDNYGFTPGIRVAYRDDSAKPEWWGVSLGVFAAGEGAAFNDSFRAPFLIAQLEKGYRLFGGLGGSYRLYGWSNGQASRFNDGVTGEVHSGWGGSIDQRIGDAITLFSRIGISTRGTVKFDRALTLGSEFGGSYWARSADAFGVAVGWLRAGDEYQVATTHHAHTEALLELYYRWRLNSQLAITPDLQLVRHAAGDSNESLMRFVGVRATVNF